MEKIDGIPIARLSLIVKAELVPIFFQLLGQGFKVNAQIGCSVKELLCNQLGIHEDYLTERIQTIFLNAKVVDDVKSAIVNEGSILALSGAMPGLVGAILRSGGIYAGMRSQISHKENKLSSQGQTAPITLKLLNLIVKELGPIFLQRGIGINGQTLQEFTKRYAEELSAGCVSGDINGKRLDIVNLQGVDWGADQVLLQVSSEQAT
jgi:hypothetical protein